MSSRLLPVRADKAGMALFIAAILFLFVATIDARAQSGWEYLDKSPERIIGLLDLPDIVMGGCGPAPKRGTASAFATPSNAGAQVGMVHVRDEGDAGCRLMIETAGGIRERMPTMESGYEIEAAMVFERRGEWFRIRLPRGSAWVRRDPKDFLPYPDMLRERLAYILQGWDGTLRETPGVSGNVRPLSSGWKGLLDRQLSIDYLGFRRVGGDLWIHVRLITEVCGQLLQGVDPVTGWIPAYRLHRAPSVWFSSRGC
jgi:hypothetical protein